MRRTLQWLALFFVIALILIALPLIFHLGDDRPDIAGIAQLPWEIEHLPDGASRVFGLVPGRSTLQEARAALGVESGLGLVVAPGEEASLEAFFDPVRAGYVTGKLVVRLEASRDTLAQMQQRATKIESLGNHAKRINLSPEDEAIARQATIMALAFIPTADLDAEIVKLRFGEPEERIAGADGREHWLYKQKGLEVQIDPKGKEVLQYVAPREFERLLSEPLKKGKG